MSEDDGSDARAKMLSYTSAKRGWNLRSGSFSPIGQPELDKPSVSYASFLAIIRSDISPRSSSPSDMSATSTIRPTSSVDLEHLSIAALGGEALEDIQTSTTLSPIGTAPQLAPLDGLGGASTGRRSSNDTTTKALSASPPSRAGFPALRNVSGESGKTLPSLFSGPLAQCLSSRPTTPANSVGDGTLTDEEYVHAMKDLMHNIKSAETAHRSFVGMTTTTWGIKGFVDSRWDNTRSSNTFAFLGDGDLVNKDMMEIVTEEYDNLLSQYSGMVRIRGRSVCQHHGGLLGVPDCLIWSPECNNDDRVRMKAEKRGGRVVEEPWEDPMLLAEKKAAEALASLWRLCFHITVLEREKGGTMEKMGMLPRIPEAEEEAEDETVAEAPAGPQA